MKSFLPFIALIITANVFAQQIEKYYDYQWKQSSPADARFISIITKADSGWFRRDYFLATNKPQMAGLYEDSATNISNGTFYYYYSNGMLESAGRYTKKKREGLWLHFYRNGSLSDSTVYENGEPTGTSIGWHENGYQSDSVVYDKDGHAVEVNWFDNGVPASAGNKVLDKLHGTWNYFHKNGNPAAKEKYDMGKLISRTYYNEQGTEETDTTSKNRNAAFPGGNEGWKKFILKHIYFPDQYRLVNADKVTVVVSAVIDEEGNVMDPLVEIPFSMAFDKIAVEIFKKSPKWIPAIRYNRTVKQVVKQPITFSQAE